jgi:inosine-uridine nucleoside N-ribohydrolase
MENRFLKYVALCGMLGMAVLAEAKTKVIFDHDGAFEDLVALTALVAKTKDSSSSIELIGVTTQAHGEAYCNGSSGYPDLKREILENPENHYDYATKGGTPPAEFTVEEGTINGITEKILIATQLDIPIYTACGEETTSIEIDNGYANDPPPGVTANELEAILSDVQIELTMEGLKGQGPCTYHKANAFVQGDVTCYREFTRAFRDETIRFVLPAIQTVIDDFGPSIPIASLLNEDMSASDYLANQICRAYMNEEDLVVATVGPATNLGRAYEKISRKPKDYGCRPKNGPASFKIEALQSSVRTLHMGGVIYPDSSVLFDEYGNYRLREDRITDPGATPFWSLGNVYFQDGAYTFGGHHIPDDGCDPTQEDCFQTNQHTSVDDPRANGIVFDSLNNAEFNFWVDPKAIDVILDSGVPSQIVSLGATNNARTAGFVDLVDGLDEEVQGAGCNTVEAQLMKRIINSHSFDVFQSLFFWDTLTVSTLWDDDLVVFDDTPQLQMATLKKSDKNTFQNSSLSKKKLYKRDAGKLYFDDKSDMNPIQAASSTIPNDVNFSVKLQQMLVDLTCNIPQS